MLVGNASSTAADLKKILTSIDAECDDDAAEKLVSELSGKGVVEVLTAGREALKFFGGGGGGGPAKAASEGGGGRDGPKEAKKEEKVEEEEEEEDSHVAAVVRESSVTRHLVGVKCVIFLLHDTVCELGVRCHSEDFVFCPQEMDVDLFG